jgi:ribosomal protein L32
MSDITLTRCPSCGGTNVGVRFCNDCGGSVRRVAATGS